MFYEAAEIDNILMCGLCKHKLDVPRMLPCGTIVCQSCIDKTTKSINPKDNSFKCLACQATHKNAEFPVSKSFQKLLEKTPAEVYRCDIVEQLKSNLNDIDAQKSELEYSLLNGVDKVSSFIYTISNCELVSLIKNP